MRSSRDVHISQFSVAPETIASTLGRQTFISTLQQPTCYMREYG